MLGVSMDKCNTTFGPIFDLSLTKIKNHFIYSQMTVINESTNQKKYKFMIYVEWLEFLCRIAIFSTTFGAAPIEEKVFNLL